MEWGSFRCGYLSLMAVIEVQNVSKCYFFHRKRQLLAQRARASLARENQAFWALRDVSFKVERGERLAIVGPNGAGKSTLLGIIAGGTAPTQGSVRVQGRVSALLALGIGLELQLTGIENIHLIASLMDMSRSEVRSKINSIVEFSELADFINDPVRTYSTGMVARLGFSVAIHVDPDILILDEVLSVGDAAFQAKCTAKISEFTESEKTLLFVSHGLKTGTSMCTRGLWLNKGVLQLDGPIEEVLQSYEEFIRSRGLSQVVPAAAPLAVVSEKAGDTAL